MDHCLFYIFPISLLLSIFYLSATNVAYLKDTAQSSTFYDTDWPGFNFNSSLAVDGDYRLTGLTLPGFCTHTDYESGWWAVNLGDVYSITDVVIYGRNDVNGNNYFHLVDVQCHSC